MPDGERDRVVEPPLQLGPVPPEFVAAINPFQRAAGERAPVDEEFKVSELSARSGVAIGTIKYYLREGLLPPGRAASKTQALYGNGHVRRLRLIRALGEEGGLSIQRIGAITAAIDAASSEPVDGIAAVAYALEGAGEVDAGAGDDATRQARIDCDAFIDALGFNVLAEAPARDRLARALATLRSLGLDVSPLVFTEHAIAAYELARKELGFLETEGDDAPPPDEIAVGIVVFGQAFLALRAIAQEHETRRRFGEGSSPAR